MAVAVVCGTIGAFRLHAAADLERQTLRVQRLAGAVFRLQDFTLEAQDGDLERGLTERRARAIDDANMRFDLVLKHDREEGQALRPTYLAFLAASERAFGLAFASGGHVSSAKDRLVDEQFSAFSNAINAEIDLDAQEAREANPVTRFFLFCTVGAMVLLIAAFTWLFTMQRREGRIDRDNAARAAELMRLREEFVSSVSHELRTPLTSIIGYLDLIRDAKPGDAVPDQAALLDVVRRNAVRLLHLVNDLLFVAQVDERAMTLETRPVELGALATESVEAARPSAEAKGIELTLQKGAPIELLGDPVRLAQMMDNLVSNAVKFTHGGGRVEVTTAQQAGNALFEVSDTGVGIDPDDRAQLFDRFFRSRAASAEAAQGTGLGLTITKAIVEAHHGSIEVESAPGMGTTFRVLLPSS